MCRRGLVPGVKYNVWPPIVFVMTIYAYSLTKYKE